MFYICTNKRSLSDYQLNNILQHHRKLDYSDDNGMPIDAKLQVRVWVGRKRKDNVQVCQKNWRHIQGFRSSSQHIMYHMQRHPYRIYNDGQTLSNATKSVRLNLG